MAIAIKKDDFLLIRLLLKLVTNILFGGAGEFLYPVFAIPLALVIEKNNF